MTATSILEGLPTLAGQDSGLTALATVIAALASVDGHVDGLEASATAILAKLSGDPASQTTLEAVRMLLAAGIGVTGPLTNAQLVTAALMTNAKGEELRALLAGNLLAVAPAPTSGTVTISAAASQSGALQVDGKFVGLIMPAAWSAAAITFLGSPDNVTYSPIYDDLGERTIISADAAINRMILFELADWLGVKFVKVRSGTAAAPVVQAADRVLTLLKVA